MRPGLLLAVAMFLGGEVALKSCKTATNKKVPMVLHLSLRSPVLLDSVGLTTGAATCD